MPRTDEDERRIAKLPAWAQMMIERLESEIADAQSTIQCFHGDKATRILLDPWRRDAIKTYLPENQRIRFAVPHGHVDVSIGEDGPVEISGDADDLMGTPFVVLPHVSNVVHVGFAPRPAKG